MAVSRCRGQYRHSVENSTRCPRTLSDFESHEFILVRFIHPRKGKLKVSSRLERNADLRFYEYADNQSFVLVRQYCGKTSTTQTTEERG